MADPNPPALPSENGPAAVAQNAALGCPNCAILTQEKQELETKHQELQTDFNNLVTMHATLTEDHHVLQEQSEEDLRVRDEIEAELEEEIHARDAADAEVKRLTEEVKECRTKMNEQEGHITKAADLAADLTLRVKELETDLANLVEMHTELTEEHIQVKELADLYDDEHKIRQTLEERLAVEQVARAKHEQEVMRLKPRALELVDTSDELASCRKKLREQEFTIATLQKELRKQTLPPTPHAMLDELLNLSQPNLVDLLRVKKFILEQERIRSMLVEEMSTKDKAYITYETTHDELIRRENALHHYTMNLEDEKKKLETQNAQCLLALKQLQQEVVTLSQRLEKSDQEKEHAIVNLNFMKENHRKKIEELERYQQEQRKELASAASDATAAFGRSRAASNIDAASGPGSFGSFNYESYAAALSMTGRSEKATAEAAPVPSANGTSARKTKVVYSDALEQTISATGTNWPEEQ